MIHRIRQLLLPIILFAYCMRCIAFAPDAHNSLSFHHPIDIVYLWVDGSDPVWQALKDYYYALLYTKIPAATDEFTANRFADHEELRYSLRSIAHYAPFFNHIYIVTMNQTPHWLKAHPRITLINHTDIFKNQHDLPTFNSHALESNLHRIPGLQEYYIYFNDDVFLGAPVTAGDFFTREGKPKVLFEKSLSPSGPPIADETAYRRAWRNTNSYLDARFKVERRHRLCHSAFALRRSLTEMVEEQCAEIFASNSCHKFRCNDDYNMTNGFLQYYWSYHDLISTSSMSNMMVSLYNDDKLKQTKKALEKLKQQKPYTFCLQDVMGEHSRKTKELLSNFLQEYYPKPAPWE
jgi:hypothetical protein